MLDEIETRLQARVPVLSGRIRKAADFSRLLASRRPPTGGVSAYLIPSSRRGGRSAASAGTFDQEVLTGVTIALFLTSVDAAGAHALDKIEDLLADIERAICGWAPGEEVGVFELATSRFTPGGDGLMSWLIEFRIMDHLRIDE